MSPRAAALVLGWLACHGTSTRSAAGGRPACGALGAGRARRAAAGGALTPLSLPPAGKNDGSIGGKQYFRCNPGYGLLVRPGRVGRAAGASRRRSAGLRLQSAAEPRRSSTLSGSASNLASLTAALVKAEGAGALRAERSHKHPENRKSWAS